MFLKVRSRITFPRGAITHHVWLISRQTTHYNFLKKTSFDGKIFKFNLGLRVALHQIFKWKLAPWLGNRLPLPIFSLCSIIV